ncbi:hypothetical protein [Rubrivirga sp.]|uniref:hypothetical protein n=1 Tax=Rubrivirga sp. TaxID=1885344 RepID=UPI003C79463C
MTAFAWRCGALLFALSVSPAWAQLSPNVAAEVGVVSQSYTVNEGESVNELAVPVQIGVSLDSGLSLSLRTAYADVSGDGLTSLGGVADTQLGVGYRRALGTAIVDLAIVSNVPTGQTGLTQDEFATSTRIATDDFAFAVPSLGQGAAISPGIAIAFPAGPSTAFGVAAAYSARSSYEPFAGDSLSYTPADEVVLSAGFDAALGALSTFSLEGSYVIYGDDEVGGNTFSPGDKIAGTMRLVVGGRVARGSLLARYRHVLDGTVGTADRVVSDLRPSQARLALGLALGPPSTNVALSAGARYYGSIEQTDDLLELASFVADQQLLVDFGVAPVVTVSPGVQLRGSFTYTLGLADNVGGASLEGYRASGGLRVDL